MSDVLVCGLGQVGFRTAELLLRLGEPVMVVTLDAREERRRALTARGGRVLLADARDPARMVEAGLPEAKALLAVTNHDLVNVEIALDAKRLRPDLPVVVRLFDQQLARHLERSFEIRRALGVSAVAAPTFAAAALGERWVGSFEWGGEAFVIGRLPLGPELPFARRAVSALESGERVAVVHYEPPPSPAATGGADHPLRADTLLQAGGRVTVLAGKENWHRLAARGRHRVHS